MAEDKHFPVAAAVRPAVMATPPKTKWKVAEQSMGKYVLQLTATFTTTLEHAFFSFPKDDERYAHFIEFARYVTSSILQSDNVNPACSVVFVKTCIRENRHLFAYKLMCLRIRNIHSLTKASNSSTLCFFITGTCSRWNEPTLTANSPNQTY